MVTKSYPARKAVAAWRRSGDELLAAAAAVRRADMGADAFVALGVSTETRAFDSAVADFEWKTDAVLGEFGEASADTISLALSGGIAMVDDLLGIAEPEIRARFNGGGGQRSSWDAVLVSYQRGSRMDAHPLPTELVGKLDVLQEAAADELVALAGSDVLLGALTTGVAGLVSVAGNVVSNAAKAVSSGLSWLKEKAIKLLAWLVERLRTAMPAQFQETFDEYVEAIKEKIGERAKDVLARLLGQVLGRKECERAWQGALEKGHDLSAATAELDETVADELAWIGRIGEARARVDSVAGKIVPWLGGLVPQVQLLVGAAALIVVGAVAYQVDAGFDQIGDLVR